MSKPNVIGGGVGAVALAARVAPAGRIGRLTSIEVEVTAPKTTVGKDFFALSRGDSDLGQWALVLADGTRYTAARDSDNPSRILGGRVRGFNAGRPYVLTFYTAALPAGLKQVTVDLGQLGKVRVPVL